jgi:hypothetical protein
MRKKSARVVVVSRGEKLPVEKKGLYRMEVDRAAATALKGVARIVPVVGPSFDRGERFAAYKPMSADLSAADGGQNERIVADLYLDVTVTREEQVTYVGFLGFEPTDSNDMAFWSPNHGGLNSEECFDLQKIWDACREQPERIVKIT